MMMMNNDSKSAKKISEPQIRAKLANIERPLPWVAWTCKGLAPSAQVGAGCSPELRAKMAPDASPHREGLEPKWLRSIHRLSILEQVFSQVRNDNNLSVPTRRPRHHEFTDTDDKEDSKSVHRHALSERDAAIINLLRK